MRIKLLTINIWFGGIVWDSLVSLIHSEKPDILTIQEAYDGHQPNLDKRYRTIEEFKREFSDFLPYHTFGATVMDTSVNVPWGNAIFSKFPLQNPSTILFDLPLAYYNFTTDIDPRLAAEGMQVAEVEIENRTLTIGSWHGVWNTHGNDTPERTIMGEKIVVSLGGKSPLILAGDTNMNPTSGVIQNIQKSLNMKNVFENTLPSTFNLLHKSGDISGYAVSPVDMVFVTKEIKVAESEMIKADVSDHYPLRVIMEI